MTDQPDPPVAHLAVAGPPPESSAHARPSIELVSNRRLLSAAFELLGRSSDDTRRASFYIGVVVLGTVGPLVLIAWALSVAAVERPPAVIAGLLEGELAGVLAIAGVLAFAGGMVAFIESRALATALLGGRLAGVPVTPRQALARSRRTFWSVFVAASIVGIVLALAQGLAAVTIEPVLDSNQELSVVVTTIVTATFGAPFAYVLAGVVLGDVAPMEAIRRSFVLFRARKLAAAIVVVFETISLLLIALGALTGLDIATRLLDALGLSLDSGPAGLLLLTIGVIAIVFAFGTLLFTVMAITVAPQVVMFVGLTHVTHGLDRVRPGGRDDPESARPPFRTLPRSTLAGFALGAMTVVAAVVRLLGP